MSLNYDSKDLIRYNIALIRIDLKRKMWRNQDGGRVMGMLAKVYAELIKRDLYWKIRE